MKKVKIQYRLKDISMFNFNSTLELPSYKLVQKYIDNFHANFDLDLSKYFITIFIDLNYDGISKILEGELSDKDFSKLSHRFYDSGLFFLKIEEIDQHSKQFMSAYLQRFNFLISSCEKRKIYYLQDLICYYMSSLSNRSVDNISFLQMNPDLSFEDILIYSLLYHLRNGSSYKDLYSIEDATLTFSLLKDEFNKKYICEKLVHLIGSDYYADPYIPDVFKNLIMNRYQSLVNEVQFKVFSHQVGDIK